MKEKPIVSFKKGKNGWYFALTYKKAGLISSTYFKSKSSAKSSFKKLKDCHHKKDYWRQVSYFYTNTDKLKLARTDTFKSFKELEHAVRTLEAGIRIYFKHHEGGVMTGFIDKWIDEVAIFTSGIGVGLYWDKASLTFIFLTVGVSVWVMSKIRRALKK